MVVQESKRNSLLLSLKRSSGSFSSTTSSSTANSVSCRCLSTKSNHSTRLTLLRHKCSTIKLKLKRNSTYIKNTDEEIMCYDPDDATIVARYSEEMFHTTHKCFRCPTERISLDELADSALNAVCCQVTNEKESSYVECDAEYEFEAEVESESESEVEVESEVEELETLSITTIELQLPLLPISDESLVEFWEKFCEEYKPTE